MRTDQELEEELEQLLLEKKKLAQETAEIDKLILKLETEIEVKDILQNIIDISKPKQ